MLWEVSKLMIMQKSKKMQNDGTLNKTFLVHTSRNFNELLELKMMVLLERIQSTQLLHGNQRIS